MTTFSILKKLFLKIENLEHTLIIPLFYYETNFLYIKKGNAATMF